MSSLAADATDAGRGAAEARVRRLVAAAAELVSRREPLLAPLAADTGLSLAGVELALTSHLETTPGEEALRTLLHRAQPAEAVTVILSANVFVGALRAIAVALAASPRVVVKGSRREHLFAQTLLAAAPELAIAFVLDLDVAAVRAGELHVYGRDETIATVRAAASVPVRAHGAGFGVAEIWQPNDAAAEAVAADIVPFDQRGCLSPRVVLVHGDEAEARAFAEALHRALTVAGARVPRGVLSPEERAASVRYRETMTLAGHVWDGPDHLVACGSSFVLPPAGRHVHIAPLSRVLVESLAALEDHVTALGTDGAAPSLRLKYARVSALGAMQRPPFDGPVDLRPD
jgi:hypothetical protein